MRWLATAAGVGALLQGFAAQAARGQDALVALSEATQRAVAAAEPFVVQIEAEQAGGGAGATGAGRPAATSIGLGTRVAPDGAIVTCAHVVRGARRVVVIDRDGRRSTARVAGMAEWSDLALLRCDEPRDGLARSAAAVPAPGAVVLAFRRGGAIESDGGGLMPQMGLAGAVGRPKWTSGEPGVRLGRLQELSLQIEPGDSGGPLLDARGGWVGVMAAAGVPGGATDGRAYALPMDEWMWRVVERLRRGEAVEQSAAGIEVEPATGGRSPDGHGGAVVVSVDPRGAAGRAGLLPGDRLMRIGTQPVSNQPEVERALASAAADVPLAVEYSRGARGRNTILLTRVQMRPAGPARDGPGVLACEWRGARLVAAEPVAFGRAGLPGGAMLVQEVTEDSPADRAGLQPGDVLVRIGGNWLGARRDAERLLAGTSGSVVVGLSDGASRLVAAR